MNTPIEELIKDFEAIKKDGYNIEPQAAIELCKQYLDKEKEQIKQAHLAGFLSSGTSEDFYQNKYKKELV